MDQATIARNADRVSSIFNAVAIVVLVIGLIAAVLALIGGIFQIAQDGFGAFFGGLVAALIIAVYAIITWAGVQLAALVAGYIKLRTGTPDVPATPGMPGPAGMPGAAGTPGAPGAPGTPDA